MCRAHVATGGTPVTIHTHAAAEHGPAILQVLKEEGVDLSRVVLGQLGDAVRDPDYLAAMADTGLTLGMDRFGIDHFATCRTRSDLGSPRCAAAAYAGRMVLAHDTCCYIDWFGPGTLDDLKNWHYLHVSQDVLPYLREHGVPEPGHRPDAGSPTRPASSAGNRAGSGSAAQEIQPRSSERRRDFAVGRTARPEPVSAPLAEQVAGDANQVGAHRLHGAVRVAGAQGGHDRPVILLVQRSPLAGGAASLEVAPDLPVPGRLHDAVKCGEQRAVRGGDRCTRCRARSQVSNSS